MKSYSNNKDCFDNKGPSTDDHIWALANGGSKLQKNIQLLTRESNEAKANDNKGIINGIRFSITQIGKDDSNKKIGQMKIFKDNKWITID